MPDRARLDTELIAGILDLLKNNHQYSYQQVCDAVAEALYRHCRRAESADVSKVSVGWVIHVARNLLRDYYRRNRKLTDLPVENNDDSKHRFHSNGRTDAAAEEVTLRIVINRHLNLRMAETVWLHDVEGWKPSEIAEEQQRSVNAVKLDIKRGHARMRNVLNNEYALLFSPSHTHE